MSEPTPVRRSSPWAQAAIWILAVAVVGAVAWWLSRGDRPPGGEVTTAEAPEAEEPSDTVAVPEADVAGTPGPTTPAARAWRQATGRDPEWPDPFVPETCSEAWAGLKALCDVLDGRDYVRAHRHVDGACGFLVRVSADLAANPPPLHGELRDLLDVRHSVSHLYRTLGERRVLQLLELLTLEPDLLEPGAMALYRWASVDDRCDPAPPGPRARYDHAAWLLRTVGGQAYLRRRAPRVEALATYYALRTLDASVEAGYDPAGMDLTRDLDRAIELFAGRDDLVFGDRYAADLRATRERWRARTGDRAR